MGSSPSAMRGGSLARRLPISSVSARASPAPEVMRPCPASSRSASTRSMVAGTPQSAVISASSSSSQVSSDTSFDWYTPASWGEMACRGLVRFSLRRRNRPRLPPSSGAASCTGASSPKSAANAARPSPPSCSVIPLPRRPGARRPRAPRRGPGCPRPAADGAPTGGPDPRHRGRGDAPPPAIRRSGPW